MSLLTVNGIRVPIAADSARLGDRVVGGDVTADDGSLHRARSAYLDTLNAATRLLSPTEALAWRGLLEGRGHRLSCDTDPDYTGTDPSASPDQYTSRGLYLQGTVSRRGGYAQFGYASALKTLGNDSKFSQAIAIEASATNYLGATTRQASNAAAFTAISGAGVSAVATSPLQGTTCIQVVAAVAGRGVSWAGSELTVAAGTVYTASFYARCSTGTLAIDAAFSHSDDATSVVDTFSLTTDWRRFQITLPATVSVGATQNFLIEVTTSAGATGTFFIDCPQVEKSSFATSWVGAGSGTTDSRSGTMGLSAELVDFRRQDDVTVMGWFYGPHFNFTTEAVNATDAYLWCLGDETNGVYLYRAGSNGYLRLRFITAGVTTTEIEYTTDIGNSAWHHVAVVLRRSPTTGAYASQLFIDGASVGTDATSVPALGTSPNFIVGRYYGAVTNPWQGYVDELVVLPYALTADMISTVYAARFSDLPRLNVSGDYFGGVDVECLGRITGDGLRFTGAGDATAGFQSRNAVLAFTLAQAVR